MKDLKSLVLKRDRTCILCNALPHSATNLGLNPSSPANGHDGGSVVHSNIAPTISTLGVSPPEPNGLHHHHEYGTYGDEYWPREDVEEKSCMLCGSHHARRTQGNHYSEIRDIRKYLKNLYPDYNFGKRFNENTGAYDIPIGEF